MKSYKERETADMHKCRAQAQADALSNN